MTEPEDTNSEQAPLGPINSTQAERLINQLRDLAYAVYHHPPHDVDCAVSYEDGSSYYRVDIRWRAEPAASTQTGAITDVDAFLWSLFNERGGTDDGRPRSAGGH